MIQLYDGGAYVLNGTEIIADTVESASILAGKLGSVPEKEEAKKQTIAYGILKDHNTSDNMDKLKIRFDPMILRLWELFRRPVHQVLRNFPCPMF